MASNGEIERRRPCRSLPVVMQLEAMTRQDYEERRRRLDEELRAGRELLEASHRARLEDRGAGRIPSSYRRLASPASE